VGDIGIKKNLRAVRASQEGGITRSKCGGKKSSKTVCGDQEIGELLHNHEPIRWGCSS